MHPHPHRAVSAPPSSPRSISRDGNVSDASSSRDGTTNEVAAKGTKVTKVDGTKSPRGNKHAFQPAGVSANNRSQKKRRAGTPPVVPVVPSVVVKE